VFEFIGFMATEAMSCADGVHPASTLVDCSFPDIYIHNELVSNAACWTGRQSAVSGAMLLVLAT
jgi:hypothetical protein